jgi:hypothetical protein
LGGGGGLRGGGKGALGSCIAQVNRPVLLLHALTPTHTNTTQSTNFFPRGAPQPNTQNHQLRIQPTPPHLSPKNQSHQPSCPLNNPHRTLSPPTHKKQNQNEHRFWGCTKDEEERFIAMISQFAVEPVSDLEREESYDGAWGSGVYACVRGGCMCVCVCVCVCIWVWGDRGVYMCVYMYM